MTKFLAVLLSLPATQRLVAGTVAAAAAAAVATGCAIPQTAPPAATTCDAGQALVLVVAVHQGASAPAIPSAAACYIESALKAGVPTSIVTAEGTPRVLMNAATWTLNDGQPESSNPQAYSDDLGSARAAVITAVKGATAASDHNDLAAALSVAAGQGHQSSPSNIRILLFDNGLSDTGALNLTEPGMTAANPDEVAAFVQFHGGCPADLAGTTMTMYGAGYGVDPQPKLSNQQISAIGRIWQKVIEACGGRLELAPTPRTDPGPATTHTVTPVAPTPDAVMPVKPAGSSLTFGEDSTLRFNPDSADLIDPAAAATTLKPVADYLNEDSGHAVTVFGTTSNGPTGWANYAALAQARAETIGRILTAALGVAPNQIHCLGLGYIADPPVIDPATAALNRSTRIHIDS